MPVTPTRHLIAPSILSADFARLGEEIRAVEEAGADWIHVDVMDGHFVPNLTIGPVVIEAARAATRLPLDVHLMIEAPDAFIDRYAATGADRITVHAEACPHLHGTLAHVRNAGALAGAALNPATPATAIEPILGDVDQVVVMTVNPGFGGQQFIESVLPKISQIRRWIDERELEVALEVDGGVGPGTIGRVARAGANAFVAGSAIFRKPDYAATIAELRKEAAG
jgi:ribulose-phosphate 3-epimerase